MRARRASPTTTSRRRQRHEESLTDTRLGTPELETRSVTPTNCSVYTLFHWNYLRRTFPDKKVTGPNPTRRRRALNDLDNIFSNSANVWVIHYSCESFYDRPEGRSPRVTSIVLRKLDSAQTVSFSIHQTAERRQIPFDKIGAHYDDLEREMIAEYFAHVAGHQGMTYLHWNMRDVNYGFQAIEHRFRVLGGEPYVVEDANKVDLARLLIGVYGVGYIGHPRMEKLLEKNRITRLGFMTGEQEAEAFDARNFVALHQSTLRKVDVICNFAGRAHDRSLKTNTTWWEMYGGTVRAFVNWIMDNKALAFVASLASIGALGYAIWSD